MQSIKLNDQETSLLPTSKKYRCSLLRGEDMTPQELKKIADAIIQGMNEAIAQLRPDEFFWNAHSTTAQCVQRVLQNPAGGYCNDSVTFSNGIFSLGMWIRLELHEQRSWIFFKKQVETIVVDIEAKKTNPHEPILLFSEEYTWVFCTHIAHALKKLNIPHDVRAHQTV